MTEPAGPALTTDLGLMAAVAGHIDTRNDELRTMLQAFIGRMSAVPASVWGGVAAGRFRTVVDRWHAEADTLHTALGRIAETIRHNERLLREAAEAHAQRLDAVAGGL
ncbi:WXG100 family type VII secretion target [uncultured Mycolicibacterium sp.]|uniref:WXG100 family type VII secretion target n=1 Tax=uncultured Mycolicibacterium sp. TaxID=2320817 RepID=UPI0026282DF9|nr:WXG100 family type VII secretion target [uncultured Mycolicibacterium sp.]